MIVVSGELLQSSLLLTGRRGMRVQVDLPWKGMKGWKGGKD